MQYIGGLVIDNRTSNTTITIGIPKILNNSSVSDKTFAWSDPQPYVIQPVSGEQTIQYSLDCGVLYNATKDYIQLPITLAKNDNTSSNGTISIFTANGNTNPSSVVFQMTIDGQTATQMLNVGDLNSAISLDVSLDGINIIFTDEENITYTPPSSGVGEFILDKVVDIGIALATA